MTADAAIFVSKRLQRAAFAFLCLMSAQVLLASCEPEPAAMGVGRVTLGGAVTQSSPRSGEGDHAEHGGGAAPGPADKS